MYLHNFLIKILNPNKISYYKKNIKTLSSGFSFFNILFYNSKSSSVVKELIQIE